MGWFGNIRKAIQKDTGPTVIPAASLAKVIKVSDYLSEQSVTFFPPGISKEELLGRLVATLGLPDSSQALKAILDREAAGTTVIAPGVAVPHARVQGVPQLVASLGFCLAGVPEPGSDVPTQLFFLFVSSTGEMKEHLGFLASVASLFQTDGFASSLLQLTTTQMVLSKIRDAEKGL